MRSDQRDGVKPPCLGVVLGGGGGKGSAHLGVLSVLESIQLPIDMIVGTSIGGMIGVLYAAGYSLSEIAKRLSGSTFWRLFEREPSGTALLGNRRTRLTLEDMLGERTFEELAIPCAVVTIDLVTGREVVLDRGPLVNALMATMAFPGIFPPVPWGEMLLADGGTINNLPVDVAYARGADKVIAVDLGIVCEDFQPTSTASGLLGIANILNGPLSIANRGLAIMIAEMTRARLAEWPPDVLLCPQVEHIGLLEISSVDKGYTTGVDAALNAMNDLHDLQEWRTNTGSISSTQKLYQQSQTLPASAYRPVIGA